MLALTLSLTLSPLLLLFARCSAAASRPVPKASSRRVAPPGIRCAIEVTLDPARHRLTGVETLVYRSGADTALTALHFHAYPNAFAGPHTLYGREAERVGEDYALRFAAPGERGWMSIDSASVGGVPAPVFVEETLARVDLPRPLAPGDSVRVTLRFAVQVPKPFSRFGRAGTDYAVAQWYPKVCVYDELGWHLDPYHYLAEFYGEFASFDVAITVPDRYWVGATGAMTDVAGGDNEAPPFPWTEAPESVSVRLSATTVDSLSGRWPTSLEAVTDLEDGPRQTPRTIAIPREGGALLRVPRGSPVHYAYRWNEGRDAARSEADPWGRSGPLRLLIARRDTSVTDTLRALARRAAPGDTSLPSMKTIRFRADRVHDFAWVASPDYVRADTTWSGISIRALVYRDEHEEWGKINRFTIAALRYLTSRVGPYVWPTFTVAEAPVGGGAMEYPTLIMNDSDSRSDWLESLDFVTAHETAHNWFYGMVASDERAHPWLDEGFCHFLESEYADSRYPQGLFRERKRFPWIGALRHFDIDESQYLARVWAEDERPVDTPADRLEGYPQYGVTAYIKPAMMLRALRGQLGDSLFNAFLHAYYRRGLLRHPVPGDVERAASEVSGSAGSTSLDVREFFEQWIQGTGRAGFAIGGVRRERRGDRHRSTVIVRRTGEMALPVTLEARFGDGSRREKWVVPRDRETRVVFESNARLASAKLDPRHMIAEPYRLDNATGLLPPIRFVALYGFPTSDELTVRWGPTLWHGREEGPRAGLWWDGRYLASRDFPDGIRGISGGVAVGARDGSVAWRLGVSRRAGLLGARGSIAASAVRDAGMFRGGVTASNWITAPARRHPFRRWTVRGEYRDRYDLAPVDGRYWSEGRAIHVEAKLGLETIGPRRRENADLSLGRGFSALRPSGDRAPDVQYDRLALSLRQSLDLMPRGNLKLQWRVLAGSAWRRVPREMLLDAAEASRLDAIQSFYLNDRGPVVASGRYWNPGGGGLRGYAGRAILGQRAIAINVDAQLPWVPRIGWFADLGRVGERAWGRRGGVAVDGAAGSGEGAGLLDRTLADAGITLDFGPVRVTAPVWVGTPPPDEKRWRLRWLVTLGRLPTLP